MAPKHTSPEFEIVPRTPATAEDIYAANERLQELFRAELAGVAGAQARANLANKRKAPDWLVDEEGFGYIPDGRDHVVRFAQRSGVSLEHCADAGLVKRSVTLALAAFRKSAHRAPTSNEELSAFWYDHSLANDPTYYYDFPSLKTEQGDFKSGDWMTLPIRARDAEGRLRIAGFQYRSMRPDHEIGKQGRYRSPLNSAALVWAETLTGLAEELPQIEASGMVVLCEGKFDQVAVKAAVRDLAPDRRPGVIALNGVASRGADEAATTPEARAGVLAALKGARSAVLFTDSDDRGTKAILTVGPLLSALGVHVGIARIEDADWRSPGDPADVAQPKDPDELWAKGGAAPVLQALDRGRSRGLGTFAAAQLEAELRAMPYGGQLWQRFQLLDRVLPVLRALPGVTRGKAVARVAQAIALDERVLLAALGDAAPARTASGPQASADRAPARAAART